MPDIVTKMTADTSEFERKMKSAQRTAVSASSNITNGFSNVSSGFSKMVSFAGKATFAIGAVSTAMAALNGKNLDSIRYAFDRLAASFQTDGAIMLSELNRVSNGMVSDFELMSAAAKGMQLGLDPKTLVGFMEIAAASSKATGQTMTEAFNDIVVGAARQSRMILDNLGIIVQADKAYEAYAQQLGVSVNALTDMQKRQAFLNEIQRQGQVMVKNLGADTQGVMSENAKLVASATNLWDGFTTTVQKSMNVVSGWVNKFIDHVKSVNEQIWHIGGAGLETKAPAELPEVTNAGMDMTTPLNGNGVAAVQDKAKLAKEQAKELEKSLKEISDIIDAANKDDAQRIDDWYKENLEKVQGNNDARLQLEEAYQIKKAELEQSNKEAASDLLDEEREKLLSRREAELEELQEWYDRVLEMDTLSKEQQLEAEQIYQKRKLEIQKEASAQQAAESERLAQQEKTIADKKDKMEEKQKKIRLQGIMAFGDLALKHGGKIGEKIFMASRVAAAASAIVDTHAAVMKTMASTPYPYNIPLAAAQAAIGAGQVASILSTTFGSTSSGSSNVSGGGGGVSVPTTSINDVTATPAAAEEEKKGNLTINIQGDIMNEDYVDLLAERISEAVEERNVILKASQVR